MQEGQLVYEESAVSSQEKEWLEELGIAKASDYYTVEFDSSGGTEIASQSIRAGRQANRPSNPEKSGLEFLGWYYLQEGGTEENPTYTEYEFDFNTAITTDYSLYAKYIGEAVLMARNENYGFWQKNIRPQITSINFKKQEISVPSTAVAFWDVKADSNCADITAYIEESTEGTYTLTIVSPYTIYANQNEKDYFNSFTSLSNIDFGNFDTIKVATMHAMFYNNSALTNLDLSQFKTSNVNNMRSMFGKCSALTSLDLSKFDTSKVTKMCLMFNECSSLISLDVSRFNTSRVTTMRNMFDGCTNLKSLDLSSFDTKNVVDMYKMFNVCKAITTIDISNFNTKNVTNMGMMFYNCPQLTTIYAGENFNTEKVQNGYVFRYNSKLIGGEGTKFSSQHTNQEYARIDGGPSNPGYFTLKEI